MRKRGELMVMELCELVELGWDGWDGIIPALWHVSLLFYVLRADY